MNKTIDKHVLRVILFSMQWRGWHTFATDRLTLRAIRRAASLGVIEVNRFEQFRYRED